MSMSGLGWEPDDPFTVDFSGERHSKEKIRGRAQQTEYDNVDLASGYPRYLIWETGDGRRIAIPNMSDDHLLNTIAYLRRREEEYKQMHIAKIARGVINMAVDAMMFARPLARSRAELELELVAAKKEGAEIYALPKEAWLRKYNRYYPYLLRECYKRKLLIEVDSSKIGDT